MIDSNCPIWVLGKGYCWAPSAAWGCTDSELCAKCKSKSREKEEVPIVLQQLVNPVKENQICDRCGGETYKGRMQCTKCLQNSRTCRFCGMQNVNHKQWRAKDKMCSKKDCWERFLKELKFAV